MDNNITQQLSRKERERLHRRQEIVNAAREVFALRGFSAATLEEIAERAEFGKGTLYGYFHSKDELFETVIADIFDEIVQIAADTCSVSGAGLEQSYRDFASRMLRHLFENCGIYFLMIREIHNMHHHSHFATLFPDLLLLLAEPLRRSLPEAAQAVHKPEQLGFMFLTMILSLFRSSMHMFGLQGCQTDNPPPAVSRSDIERNIERCVATLEQVYFKGILSMTNTNTAK